MYLNRSREVVCKKNGKKGEIEFQIITGNDPGKVALFNKYRNAYLKYSEYDMKLSSVRYKKQTDMPASFNNELFIPELISKSLPTQSGENNRRQKNINDRIKSGNITKDEAVCYFRRYPDIQKKIGGIYKVAEGQSHWKNIGRWQNLDPLCDGKEYTGARYEKLNKKIKGYKKKIKKETKKIKKIADKNSGVDDELGALSGENKTLHDLLYVDYPFQDEEISKSSNIVQDNIEVGEMMEVENFENYNDEKKYMLYEGMGLYDKILEVNDDIKNKKREVKTNFNKFRALDKKNNDLNTEMKNNFLLLQNRINSNEDSNENDTSDDDVEDSIIENMTIRDRYKGYLQMKQQEIKDIENQNKFLDNEMSKQENSNMTYERKSEFKKENKSIFEYINQQFLFYIYVCVALFSIYLFIFKLKDIPRYLIVLFTLTTIIYPFYIYSFELVIYNIWNFIYSNFVGEPMR
jgi:hypothetical protein